MSRLLILTIDHRATGWHWNLTDPRNAETLDASTQRFSRRADCFYNLDRVTGLRPPMPTDRRRKYVWAIEDCGPRIVKSITLRTETSEPAPRKSKRKAKSARKGRR